jgi:5'-methylthioadenosine phosphorylase
MRIAVIGGTGIYDPAIFGGGVEKDVDTPYGKVRLTLVKPKRRKGIELVFMPRHGASHAVPPHRVNYRANLYALKILGVERILATNSVGCISPDLKPGDMVVPHDFIDFTKSRAGTFYDAEAVHVDVSEPYCPELRQALIEAGKKLGVTVVDGAVYGCTEGPRFETPAEIRFLGMAGADLVGMTGIPETVLARELEICYASICTVTNYAAGIARGRLTATEVVEIVEDKQSKLRKVVYGALGIIPEKRGCDCKDALKEARVKRDTAEA